MSKKILIIFLILAFVLPVAATTKIKRLGPHAFYKSKNLTPDDLYKIAIDFAGDVKIGFEEAGYGDLVLPFLDQLKNAKVEEIEIQPGETLEWMMFRTRKRVKVVKDVEWAGRKPIKAYKVTIYHDLKAYEIIVPKICGNISLKSVTELPAPVCALKVAPARVEIGNPVTFNLCSSQNWARAVVKVMLNGNLISKISVTPDQCDKATFTAKDPGNYTFEAVVYDEHGFASSNSCAATVEYWKNQPPVCDLQVSPAEVLTGEEVTLDASGSSDPEGKLIGVKFTIRKDGNVVEEKTLTTPPYIYKFKPTKAGNFNVTVIAEDDHHVTSSGCAGMYKVLRRGFFMGETGLMAQSDPRWLVPLRLGYQYRIDHTFRFAALAGPAIVVKGKDENDDYGTPITADLIFFYYPERFFFGAGVGAWIVSGDNKADFIGKLGYEVYSTDNSAVSLFFEGRLPFANFDSKADQVRLLFGINFRF